MGGERNACSFVMQARPFLILLMLVFFFCFPQQHSFLFLAVGGASKALLVFGSDSRDRKELNIQRIASATLLFANRTPFCSAHAFFGALKKLI